MGGNIVPNQTYGIALILKGIIAVLLLLCLIDADYGFYQAIRTIVSFGFAFLTYRYHHTGEKTNAIIFLCLLIVFQPVMKIAFGRDIWIVIDVLVAGFLIYQILHEVYMVNRQSKRNQATNNTITRTTNQVNTPNQSDIDNIRSKW